MLRYRLRRALVNVLAMWVAPVDPVIVPLWRRASMVLRFGVAVESGIALSNLPAQRIRLRPMEVGDVFTAPGLQGKLRVVFSVLGDGSAAVATVALSDLRDWEQIPASERQDTTVELERVAVDGMRYWSRQRNVNATLARRYLFGELTVVVMPVMVEMPAGA